MPAQQEVRSRGGPSPAQQAARRHNKPSDGAQNGAVRRVSRWDTVKKAGANGVSTAAQGVGRWLGVAGDPTAMEDMRVGYNRRKSCTMRKTHCP